MDHLYHNCAGRYKTLQSLPAARDFSEPKTLLSAPSAHVGGKTIETKRVTTKVAANMWSFMNFLKENKRSPKRGQVITVEWE